MGYHTYAFALSKFITAKETKTPLCLSIQAPWGGGKTSLMRMIQKMLDSNSQKELENESVGKAHSAEERPRVKQILSKLKPNRGVKLNQILIKLKRKWVQEIKDKEYPVVKEPESFDETKLEPRITIWFNAWKYEGTEQVWAGLADSIIKGVADRLDPVEREWFYLRLNLHRLDKDSIRNWIYHRIWLQVWYISIVIF